LSEVAGILGFGCVRGGAMTNIATDGGEPPNNADFYRRHTLGELLAGSTPINSVDDLLISDLSDDEADAFYAALYTCRVSL
jgi:hypothetical protein